MRFFEHAHYKFIEARKKAYVVSGTAILIGIAAMVVNIFSIGSWQNYGIDFTGGTLVQVEFAHDVAAGDLRAALGGSYVITRFGAENAYAIRAPLAENETIDQVATGIQQKLSAAMGSNTVTVVGKDLVSAKVGSELTRKAALAVLFSFIITLIYLAFRFETRFGTAAIIATAHDILITLGFLAVFRMEISLTTVAAVLTIVGYSLNDTIIVFDRIRENLHKKGARKRVLTDLINDSINETLPRTILTSGTTVAVLMALLLLGGAVIRDFTVVLIMGIVVGTYSSIFVASPALVEIQKRWGEGKIHEKKQKPATATV